MNDSNQMELGLPLEFTQQDPEITYVDIEKTFEDDLTLAHCPQPDIMLVRSIKIFGIREPLTFY